MTKTNLIVNAPAKAAYVAPSLTKTGVFAAATLHNMHHHHHSHWPHVRDKDPVSFS